MTAINPNKVGVAFGLVIGGWHLVWAALVAAGAAQAVLNFVFWLHFIKPVYTVGPFNPAVAVLLVGVTAIIGYAAGAAFGLAWNWIATGQRKRVMKGH